MRLEVPRVEVSNGVETVSASSGESAMGADNQAQPILPSSHGINLSTGRMSTFCRLADLCLAECEAVFDSHLPPQVQPSRPRQLVMRLGHCQQFHRSLHGVQHSLQQSEHRAPLAVTLCTL